MSNRWRRGKSNLPTHATVNPKLSTTQQFQVTATQSFYSGPVAHPEFAERWETVLPGAADRIMVQFEKQSAHRQMIESRQLGWNNVKEILGMAFAFLIFLTGVLGGVYLISIGMGTQGLVALILALVTPLALFIAGRKGAMSELWRKRQAVESSQNPPPGA